MSTLWILAAEGPNGKFIPGDPKEFWYGSAAFLIVFGLLVWKLFPVINKALARQGEKVRGELAAAEAAQAAADAEVAELRSRLGDPAADATRIVADAKANAEKLRVDLIAKADADAVALRARAVSDIEAMRSQVQADVQAEVSVRALEAAEEVVRTNLDDETQRRLIEQYIEQVGASS